MGVPEPARSRESPPPSARGAASCGEPGGGEQSCPNSIPGTEEPSPPPLSPTGGREGWGCPHPIPGEPSKGSLMVPAQPKRRRLVWLLSEGCESTGRAARLSLNRQNEDKGTE